MLWFLTWKFDQTSKKKDFFFASTFPNQKFGKKTGKIAYFSLLSDFSKTGSAIFLKPVLWGNHLCPPHLIQMKSNLFQIKDFRYLAQSLSSIFPSTCKLRCHSFHISAHPNLVAFLTHGGINSITETLNIGKPIITVPVFGDQMRNGILAERAGFGKMLTIPDITVEGKLRNAFAEMLTNNRWTFCLFSLIILLNTFLFFQRKKLVLNKNSCEAEIIFRNEFGILYQICFLGLTMWFLADECCWRK